MKAFDRLQSSSAVIALSPELPLNAANSWAIGFRTMRRSQTTTLLFLLFSVRLGLLKRQPRCRSCEL